MGRTKGGAHAGLSERDLKFVEVFMKTGSQVEAARACGMTDAQASSKACSWAKRPAIKKAIEEATKVTQDALNYGHRQAVEELDKRIADASRDKQHSAIGKLMELKMKSFGMLVDKVDIRNNNPLTLLIQGFGDERKEIAVQSQPLTLLDLKPKAEEEDDGSDLID